MRTRAGAHVKLSSYAMLFNEEMADIKKQAEKTLGYEISFQCPRNHLTQHPTTRL